MKPTITIQLTQIDNINIEMKINSKIPKDIDVEELPIGQLTSSILNHLSEIAEDNVSPNKEAKSINNFKSNNN